MMKCFTLIFSILLASFCDAQTSFFQKADSLNSKRVITTSAEIGLTWTASTIGFSNIWYSDFPKSKFHSFDDSQNWLQMDKVGHFYTSNKLSLIACDLFEWTGMKKRNATLLGSGIGLGLLTTLELMDGTSKQWGFSWSDIAANTLGSASFAIQNLIWNDQRFIFKFSYHPTEFAEIRPSVLGATFSERFLKDYNGQTYWMSFSPASFMKSSKIPQWLCFSLGYSINQKLVGDQEAYFDITTNTTYHSQREWFLSLDIDFSKLPVKRIWLRTLVRQLNHVKIPFPAFIFSDGRFRGNGFYF